MKKNLSRKLCLVIIVFVVAIVFPVAVSAEGNETTELLALENDVVKNTTSEIVPTELDESIQTMGNTPNLSSTGYQSPTNPFTRSGYGGQCTAFVWGRSYEKLGKSLPFLHDAISFWNENNSTKYYSSGNSDQPRNNSIAVWSGGGTGHVAFVEEVIGDTVYFNEANWNTFKDTKYGGGYDGYLKSSSINGMKKRGNFTLLGYIYLSDSSSTLPFRPCIDAPIQGDVQTGKTFLLRGWALHQNSISRMTYKINDGSEKELNRVARDDVFGVFPEYRSTNNSPGFAQDIDCDELAVGSNVVYVFADTTDGKKEVGRVGIVRNILPLASGIFENNKVLTDSNPILDGWVLHGSGITKLTYAIDGGPEVDSTLIKRPDVENNDYLQGYPKVNSGINIKLNLGELSSGSHTITLKATAGTGKVYSLEQRTFIVKENTEPVKTIKRNGKIYSIYNQSLNWDEAKAKAESLGGCLMSITSAEENDIAKELIQSSGRRETWIGGTDQAKEGVWQWLTTENFTYTNWGTGEPNNAGGSENSIAILNSEKMYWNDFPSNYLGGSFIVEDDDDQPEISNIQVTDVSSSGYTVTCTITDKSGINRVQFPTWTLSNGQDDLAGDWQTSLKYSGVINGNTVSFRVNDADHNYEKGVYRTHIYAYDYYGNAKAVRVEDSCGDTTIGGNMTPVSTVKLDDSEYQLFDDVLSFSDAKIICDSLGGHLVTITSQDEQNVLQNLISKGKRTAYFIGVSDEGNEGTFTWINGEAFSYTNWNNGEPNNSTGVNASGEDYGSILTSNGKWNDVPATYAIGFICEKPIAQSLLVPDLKTDKVSNQAVGTWIGLTASASGGTAPYQYKFYAKVGGETTLIQDYSTSSTAVVIPEKAGSYTLFVDIKDSTGTTATKTIDSFIIYSPQAEDPVDPDDDSGNTDTTDVTCSYQTHVQNVGWQDWKTNGEMSGTSGKGLRLEGIRIKTNTNDSDLGLSYATHVQNIGWQDPVTTGVMSGTSGKSLRLEAIRINLTGTKASQYDIYYRVHVQNIGWLDWAKNGENSGTAGFGYRLEGIEIIVKAAGSAAPGKTDHPFMEDAPKSNVWGNTPGNLMNYGRVASQNEMTYLSFYYHYNLYSRLSDGAVLPYLEMEKYYNMNSLNIKDDWIYYSLRHVLSSADTSLDGIYKMKTDGTNKSKLLTANTNRMTMYNDQLFYLESQQLYSTDLDGNNQKVIASNSSSFTIDNGLIYYEAKDRSLHSIQLDGKNDRMIISGSDFSGSNLLVEGQWLYFTKNSQNDCNLYRVKTDGSELTKLSNESIGSFNIADGFIYCGSYKEASLSKMKLDGTELRKLVSINQNDLGVDYGENKISLKVTAISIINNQIYYSVADPYDGVHYFNITTSGDNNKKID